MRRCSESVCQHLARHPAVHKEPASGSGQAEIIKEKLAIVGGAAGTTRRRCLAPCTITTVGTGIV